MTTVTYEKLMNFENFAMSYLKKDAKNQDTKFGYALLKVLRSPEYTKVKKMVAGGDQEIKDEFKILVEELEIDLCQVDKDGSIIYDTTTDKEGNVSKGYRFTKEAMKNRNKKILKLKREYEGKLSAYIEAIVVTEYEIRPYFATLVPELTDIEHDAFDGIVIDGVTKYKENGTLPKQPDEQKSNIVSLID